MLVLVDALLHKYKVPPLAVNVVAAPLQIETTGGEMDAIGLALTTTFADAVAEQLFPLITVTE